MSSFKLLYITEIQTFQRPGRSPSRWTPDRLDSPGQSGPPNSCSKLYCVCEISQCHFFFYQLFYGYWTTHKSQSNSVKRCNFERCHCQYQLPNGLFRNFVPHFLIYYFSLSRLYCIRSIEI